MNSLIAFTTNPSIGPALSILSSSVSSLYKSYLNHSTSLFASLASQYQFLQPFKPFFRRFLVLSSVPLAVFVIVSVCSTVISVVVGVIAAVTFSVFWILGSSLFLFLSLLTTAALTAASLVLSRYSGASSLSTKLFLLVESTVDNFLSEPEVYADMVTSKLGFKIQGLKKKTTQVEKFEVVDDDGNAIVWEMDDSDDDELDSSPVNGTSASIKQSKPEPHNEEGTIHYAPVGSHEEELMNSFNGKPVADTALNGLNENGDSNLRNRKVEQTEKVSDITEEN